MDVTKHDKHLRLEPHYKPELFIDRRGKKKNALETTGGSASRISTSVYQLNLSEFNNSLAFVRALAA